MSILTNHIAYTKYSALVTCLAVFPQLENRTTKNSTNPDRAEKSEKNLIQLAAY